MIKALFWSSVLVGATLISAVVVQAILGRTLLSDDPAAVSDFLSSLAQFAAIPITIAFGIVVLIIQQQANTYTSRAGALVVGSPGFLFVAALLLEVPLLCVVVLGRLSFGKEPMGLGARQWAGGTVGPVLLTLVALAVFTGVWFGRVSPADFAGFMFARARSGARSGNRNTVSLAVRGLGEMLNNLVLSTDYTSLHLCMNYLGGFLREYVGDHKPKLKTRNARFFAYSHPTRNTDLNWVEKEGCTFVGNAVDGLLGRLGPAESIYYLVDGLIPFGDAAIERGDMEALEVLAGTYVGMGTTEKTFGVSVNFNLRPLEHSAWLVHGARNKNDPKVEALFSAAFFILFAFLDSYVRQSGPGSAVTSSVHLEEAKRLKFLGVDFSEAAKESRKRFGGYWKGRFQYPDAEQAEALKRIEQF